MKKSLVFLFAMTLVLSGCSAFDSDVDGDISSIPVPEEWVDSEGNVSVPDNILTETTTTAATTVSKPEETYEAKAGSVETTVTTPTTDSDTEAETERTYLPPDDADPGRWTDFSGVMSNIVSEEDMTNIKGFVERFSDYYTATPIPEERVRFLLSTNLGDITGDNVTKGVSSRYGFYKVDGTTEMQKGTVYNTIKTVTSDSIVTDNGLFSYCIYIGQGEESCDYYMPQKTTLSYYGVFLETADRTLTFIPLLVGTDDKGYYFCKPTMDLVGYANDSIAYLNDFIG